MAHRPASTIASGGVCNPDVSLPYVQACNDHHGMALSLTTEWQSYEILFSELQQEGTGLSAAFDPSSVYTFEFPISRDSQFELQIDDLMLLKKPAGGDCP